MPMTIVTIPCLADNYTFLLHDDASGETAVIDVPESAPVSAALKAHGWTLSHVLLTHHHYDHVDGLAELLAEHPAQVVGAAPDAHRLPKLDVQVSEGDSVTIGGEKVQVIDVSGHTVGHIAYYFPDTGAMATGDSLMALGCGRLFEGTADQMWESLSKLAALPADTIICSGHEYTLANARFAVSIEPGNAALQTRLAATEAARANGTPTVPSILSEELATNPFLRGHSPEVQASVGLPGADPGVVFAAVRKRKDSF